MKSFISWISGKNYLKKVITEQMPNKFNRYIEVFGGAGWVLFSKRNMLIWRFITIITAIW